MGNRTSGQLNQILLTLMMFFVITLAGCESWLPDAHRLDPRQGNVIERKQLDNIKLGMSKSEVSQVLGIPMINDPFHADRWDYIYRYIPGRGETVQSHVSLQFKGDRLQQMDDSNFQEHNPNLLEDNVDRGSVETTPKPEID